MTPLDIEDKLDGFDDCDEKQHGLNNQPGDPVKRF